jgi:hypothetical protein
VRLVLAYSDIENGNTSGMDMAEKPKSRYLLCGKHYFLLNGMQVSDFVLFMIWWVRSWGMPYDLYFPVILLVIWILSFKLRPVKIRVRGDLYTMRIRNDDYGREFAMLNNLNPI